MDPVKRAALFIKMNDLVVQKAVVIPVTWRNVLHAAANNLAGVELNSWDSIFGRIAYWYRAEPSPSATPQPRPPLTLPSPLRGEGNGVRGPRTYRSFTSTVWPVVALRVTASVNSM